MSFNKFGSSVVPTPSSEGVSKRFNPLLFNSSTTFEPDPFTTMDTVSFSQTPSAQYNDSACGCNLSKPVEYYAECKKHGKLIPATTSVRDDQSVIYLQQRSLKIADEIIMLIVSKGPSITAESRESLKYLIREYTRIAPTETKKKIEALMDEYNGRVAEKVNK